MYTVLCLQSSTVLYAPFPPSLMLYASASFMLLRLALKDNGIHYVSPAVSWTRQLRLLSVKFCLYLVKHPRSPAALSKLGVMRSSDIF